VEKLALTAGCVVACLENKRKLKVVDNGYGFWRVKKKVGKAGNEF